MKNEKPKFPRIQARFLIGLLLIILSSSITNLYYYRDLKKLNKVTSNIIEHPYIVNKSARDIEIYINAIHRSMKDIVLSRNKIELNNSIDFISKNEQLIYDNFEIIRGKFLGDPNFISEAYTTFVNWKPIRYEVIELVKNGNIDVAARVTKEKENDHIILLFQKIHKMIEFADGKAETFNQNSLSILNKGKRNFLIIFISSTVLGILLFIWIYYSFSIPITNFINRIKTESGDNMKGFQEASGNQLAILDFAISEFENRERNLEEKVILRTNELREARNLLDNAINNAPIGMVEVDLDGKFKKTNLAFCDMLGYSRKELSALTFNEITFEEDKYIGKNFLAKAIKGKQVKAIFEKRYIHKSGRIVLTSLTTALVNDANNKPLYLFSQIIDITEERKSKSELTAHKNKLEDSIKERTSALDNKTSKLEKSQQALTFLLEDVNDIKKQLEISNSSLQFANKELESFSYSVSHDLKAPLRAIMGFSEILKEDLESSMDPESKRYLGLIMDNADNMGMLINDLLNFSRTGKVELRKSQVDLHAIALRVKSEFMTELQNRKLSIKIKPMPLINADGKLMHSVIFNLISNAVKFSAKIDNAKVEAGFISQDKQNVFYIKDNGIGFDMKYADKIFDVFQRLHSANEFQGTGIGLSIVQRIIHRHKGKIWVESEKNKGTTFFFTIYI